MRGLKLERVANCQMNYMSHPAWDAWIEMLEISLVITTFTSRIPHGMRGLKLFAQRAFSGAVICRIPHGMRGLK